MVSCLNCFEKVTFLCTQNGTKVRTSPLRTLLAPTRARARHCGCYCTYINNTSHFPEFEWYNVFMSELVLGIYFYSVLFGPLFVIAFLIASRFFLYFKGEFRLTIFQILSVLFGCLCILFFSAFAEMIWIGLLCVLLATGLAALAHKKTGLMYSEAYNKYSTITLFLFPFLYVILLAVAMGEGPY